MTTRRWMGAGAGRALLVCALLGALGCGSEGDGVMGVSPPSPPADQTTAPGLRLDESAVRAVVVEGELRVRVTLERTRRAPARGRLSLALVALEQGAVEAEAEVPFDIDGDAATVEAALALPPGLLDAPGDHARYVISYRAEWDGPPLQGRRSLLTATTVPELQLLGDDRLLVDLPSYLRLISRDPRTGEALADLPVVVRLAPAGGGEPVVVYEGRTDALGLLAARLEPALDLLGDHELQVEVQSPAGPQRLTAPVTVERRGRVLLTTDKPIYQPGQTIHMRALALRQPDQRPLADAPVVWEVFDGKANKVERLLTRTDGFGVASADFQLAREVNMGRYRITAAVGEGADGFAVEKVVTVERYALPKYDLALTLDRPVYLAGQAMIGTVRARYFFGEPVRGGMVRVAASTVDAGETVYAEQQGATNDEGLFRFEIPVPEYLVGQPLAQGGGLLRLAVEVVDTAGQARSVGRTVRVARGPLEVVVVPESGAHVPGLPQQLLVRCTDALGAPVEATIELTVNGAAQAPLATDRDGLATAVVQADGPQLAVQVSAARGEDRVAAGFTFAAGDQAPGGHVLLRTDQALYRVGDTLELQAQVIGATDRLYVDVVRAGQTVLTDVVEVDDTGRARYPLVLTPDHAGPLALSAYYLAQGSSVRRASATVYVERADDLHLSFETDRPVYAPGDQATLSVRVTDAEGNGQVAALGLQGVDEAVYSLMEFRPGLEDTYFRLEGALGQPRYQIGVPDLATLLGDDGVNSARRQQEARMLFAASGGQASHAVAINTWPAVQQQAAAVSRQAVEAVLDGFIAALLESANQTRAPWDFNWQAWVQQHAPAVADPWGQPMQIETPGLGTLVQFTSAGLDELPGTADDVQVRRSFSLPVEPADPRDYAAWYDAGGGFPDAGGGWQGGGGAVGADGGAAGGGPQGVRVRRSFPETLFVEPALITDADGRAQLQVPLADSITTWRISALANSAQGMLGSGEHGLRVFQDFFVDVDLPATLTRGDAYSAPVAVYNYLDAPLVVTLSVMPGDWFSLDGPEVIELALEPGEVAGVRLPIRVEQVGLHELTVIAQGSDGGLADGVARSLLVEPDGQLHEAATSGALDEVVELRVQVPAEAVPGSGKLLVKLFPTLISQAIDGLDGLLRMPSGCFEQTSSSTWPNVLVAEYLAETDSGSPETLLRAQQFINTGYQRLLTFEVAGGGFEWFGNPPAHTVLTAYGLLEFTDMARVRVVDEAMLERTRAWLLAQQQADGRWVAARGLDETGQLSDPLAVTAYVAFALAAAGEEGPALDRAQAWLQARAEEMGTYTTALAANFMVHFRPEAPFTAQLLARIAETVEAAVGDAPGRRWSTAEQTTTYGRGEPAAIETTALAAHALLVSGSEPLLAADAVSWLISRKSPGGAWGSTAGTVWTIKCLLASLRASPDPDADSLVRVMLDGELRAEFAVDPTNSDVVRQADLSAWVEPGRAHTLTVSRVGPGNLGYSVITRHHLPWAQGAAPEGPLHIEVAYDRTELAVDDTVTATVTIENRDEAYADMVMVELGIPPGFELVRAELDALVEGGVFRRYETTQRQLIIYFDRVEPGPPVTFAYRLVARAPIEAQAPRSRVYSYYNPEVGAGTEPTEFRVE